MHVAAEIALLCLCGNMLYCVQGAPRGTWSSGALQTLSALVPVRSHLSIYTRPCAMYGFSSLQYWTFGAKLVFVFWEFFAQRGSRTARDA